MFLVFITFISIFLNTVFGIIVVRQNTKSTTHRLFGLLTFVVILWAISNHISLSVNDPSSALFWIRIVMSVVAFMFALIFLFSSSFPDTESKLNKALVIPVIISIIIMQFLSFTPYIFSGTEIINDNITPITGPLIPLYAVYVIFYISATLRILFIKLKKYSGRQKGQIRVILLGLGVTFTVPIFSTLLMVVIFENTDFVALGPAYTIILMGTIAYSIIKHRFLDITPLVARTASYFLLFSLLIILYTLMLYNFTTFLPSEVNRRYISVFLALLVAFSYNPLRNFLEKFTDNIFYKGHYNTEELLSDLTHTMAQEIELKSLADDLLVKILQQMRIISGAFLVISNGKLEEVLVNGFEKEELKSLELIKLAKSSQEMYFFEEFGESESDLKELFRDLNIRVALTLKVKKELIGLLVLGPKASGDIYSNQDIELLTIFAPQAAVAMKNAQSYREIQEFSKTLEKKVEERTEELKETQKRELSKARELLKLKDEFVFIATHDLRTPVTAISGFIELIREQTDKLPKNINEDFDAIQEASKRLNQLVDDLLEVARSESGTIKIEPKPVDFVKITNATIKQVTPSADERGIKINTNYDTTHKIVMADNQKLSEIMENLLSNAVKYNKDKGSITVRTKKSADDLMVEVVDTGLGIPKDMHSRVFQKFFRAQQEGTEGIPGTGLGLFVVRMLIEKMKGKISFESTEGEGTTFVFTLPLAK